MTENPRAAGEHSHATENDNLKPGQPPRPATEPHGSKGSSDSEKTLTDPATGQPTPGRPVTGNG